MTRQLRTAGYIAISLLIGAVNTIERWHSRRTRTWNAGHHSAVTTRPRSRQDIDE